MNDPTPGPANTERLRDQVFSARLEAIEARMDARIASLEATSNALIRRMEEKLAEIEARFVQIDNRFVRNRQPVRSDGSADVDDRSRYRGHEKFDWRTADDDRCHRHRRLIGVAAFNATVLNNMLASFASGRNVSAAHAQIQRQAEESAALLRQIQQGLPGPVKK